MTKIDSSGSKNYLKTRRETSTSFEISPELHQAERSHTLYLLYFMSAIMILLFSVSVYYSKDLYQALVFLPLLVLVAAMHCAFKKMGGSYFKIIVDSKGFSVSSVKDIDGVHYKYDFFDKIEVLRLVGGPPWKPLCKVLLKKKNSDGADTIVLDQSFQTLTGPYEEAKLFKDIEQEILFYGFEKSVITAPEKWMA